MDNFENEDQNLDNLDGQEEELDSELIEDEPGEDPPPKRGNVNAALREERERRKQLEREHEETRRELQQQRALLTQLNTKPKVDQTQYREQLREQVYDQPDVVLNELGNNIERRMIERNAPMVAATAQNYLANHPEHKEIYAIPEIKQAIDQHLFAAAKQYGSIDFNDLENSLRGLKVIAQSIKGKQGQPADSGKSRITSTVTKTPSGSKTALSDDDVYRQALQLPPKKYQAWEKDPKNRELMTRVLFKK